MGATRRTMIEKGFGAQNFMLRVTTRGKQGSHDDGQSRELYETELCLCTFSGSGGKQRLQGNARQPIHEHEPPDISKNRIYVDPSSPASPPKKLGRVSGSVASPACSRTGKIRAIMSSVSFLRKNQ